MANDKWCAAGVAAWWQVLNRTAERYCRQLAISPTHPILIPHPHPHPALLLAGEEEPDEEAAAEAEASGAAAKAEAEAAAHKQRLKRPDLDAIVDLSNLDLAPLELPSRMPPLARVRWRRAVCSMRLLHLHAACSPAF
jgi:hypothetical protein